MYNTCQRKALFYKLDDEKLFEQDSSLVSRLGIFYSQGHAREAFV